jgi:hypothetical protein
MLVFQYVSTSTAREMEMATSFQKIQKPGELLIYT